MITALINHCTCIVLSVYVIVCIITCIMDELEKSPLSGSQSIHPISTSSICLFLHWDLCVDGQMSIHIESHLYAVMWFMQVPKQTFATMRSRYRMTSQLRTLRLDDYSWSEVGGY